MLTNSWCMGICRRLCSHRRRRAIKYCRETSVGFIVIHYLPLFDLCLSNALLLPVVFLVLTTFAIRMFIPGFILSSRSCEIINICKLFPDCREMVIICHRPPLCFILPVASGVASKLYITLHSPYLRYKL